MSTPNTEQLSNNFELSSPKLDFEVETKFVKIL